MQAAVLMAGCLLAGVHFAGAAAAPCFVVHGRLQAFNGNPTFRIWQIGTRRILGVRDNPENSQLPVAIKQAFGSDAFSHTIYGDFKVCPVTIHRAGVMQMVRIESATRLSVRPSNAYAR